MAERYRMVLRDASLKKFDEELIENLKSNPEYYAYHMKDYDIDSDILQEFADKWINEKPDLVYLIARHPNTSKKTLNYIFNNTNNMSNSNKEFIDSVLLKNPNTPKDIQKRIKSNISNQKEEINDLFSKENCYLEYGYKYYHPHGFESYNKVLNPNLNNVLNKMFTSLKNRAKGMFAYRITYDIYLRVLSKDKKLEITYNLASWEYYLNSSHPEEFKIDKRLKCRERVSNSSDFPIEYFESRFYNSLTESNLPKHIIDAGNRFISEAEKLNERFKNWYNSNNPNSNKITDSKFRDSKLKDSRDLDLSDLEDIDEYFRQYERNKWNTSFISKYEYNTLMNNCRTAIYNLCKLRSLVWKESEISKKDYQNWLAMRRNSDYAVSRYTGDYFKLSDIYVRLSNYIDILKELRNKHSLLEANDRGLYNIDTSFKGLCEFLS